MFYEDKLHISCNSENLYAFFKFINRLKTTKKQNAMTNDENWREKSMTTLS